MVDEITFDSLKGNDQEQKYYYGGYRIKLSNPRPNDKGELVYDFESLNGKNYSGIVSVKSLDETCGIKDNIGSRLRAAKATFNRLFECEFEDDRFPERKVI